MHQFDAPSRRSFLVAGGLSAVALALSACSAPPGTGSSSSGSASNGGAGADGKLAAFDPSVAAGPDTGLAKRVGWAAPAAAAFFVNFADNAKQAVQAAGLDYVESVSDGSPESYANIIQQFQARGVGTIMVGGVDPASQGPLQQAAIAAGINIEGLAITPATLFGNTDQYAVGQSLATSAVKYIKESLGGNAEVMILNQNHVSAEVKKRHDGMLAGLKAGGDGVKVVVDQDPPANTADAGYSAANTAIQAHPDIKVFIGTGDTMIAGAYNAVKQAGKLTDDMYFGGCDGDPDALKLIADGTAYRASFGFGWSLLGYAYGKYGSDWILGKSIPRVLLVPGIELTKTSLAKYNADMADAANVFNDANRRKEYLTELGNVSFAQKSTYWSDPYVP